MSRPMQWDVATINAVLKVIAAEINKYPPESEAAAALWKLKERFGA